MVARVRVLLGREWNTRIVHVSRERNNAVDVLAQQTRKDGSLHRVWRLLPSYIIQALCLDVLS